MATPAFSSRMRVLSKTLKQKIEPLIPLPILNLLKKNIAFWRRLPDEWSLFQFQFMSCRTASYPERRYLCTGLRSIHRNVRSSHKQAEMVAMVRYILSIPRHVEGCIVEAGCFKGGSTAKLSLVAKLCGRRLIVFDSFAGIPENTESHGKTILGDHANFTKGLYCGKLEEVKDNVRKFGTIEVCEFVPGWFDDTMPYFSQKVAMAFLDVDLVSSTQTCLKYLYPLLITSGTIFSHDGHLPLCIAAIADDGFWSERVGFQKPFMPDLGKKKLLRISKPQ